MLHRHWIGPERVNFIIEPIFVEFIFNLQRLTIIQGTFESAIKTIILRKL